MEKAHECSETTTMLDRLESEVVELGKSRDRWKAAWESTNLQFRRWESEAESWRAKCEQAERLNTWYERLLGVCAVAVVFVIVAGLISRGWK